VLQKNKDNSLAELPELSMFGFHHVRQSQHFATVFRRFTGTTPSAWRKAHLGS
jgi:hypothetical protein